MRNVKKLILFVLMMALVSNAAVAGIHYVNQGDSMQAAIDAADPGDEIWVMPGYYIELINFIGKAVRLYSTGGPDVTIIDGQGAYHVIQCISGEGPDTILEGFTITGGSAFGSGFDECGGGMFNLYSSPTVTNCIFSNNNANYGGGLGNLYYSSPTVTNCTFSGNYALNGGGGMYNYNDSNPTVTDCTFTGNNVVWGGGGMFNNVSDPAVTNCTFSGNTADTYGGGMFNYDNSSPTVTNCTFTGNIANDWGGGMYNSWGYPPTLANCILWDDSPDEIFNDESSTIVTYSDVQGGWPGAGNIDADPLFADADGRLSLGSPCIDAGNDADVPPGVTTDLDGNPRIQGVCVDMGAFESEFIVIDFSGWVWMESGGDFGYSSDEDDLLYFLSFGPVLYYNITTSQWGEEGPVGWTYVSWPFLYESATSTTIFALPPESGLSVYHFRTGQWTVSPRIIP